MRFESFINSRRFTGQARRQNEVSLGRSVESTYVIENVCLLLFGVEPL